MLKNKKYIKPLIVDKPFKLSLNNDNIGDFAFDTILLVSLDIPLIDCCIKKKIMIKGTKGIENQ
jgi:hypothetical protein